MSRTVKQAYRKSRAFDKQCRCHGSCSWCFGNRMYKHLKRMINGKTDNTEQDTM